MFMENKQSTTMIAQVSTTLTTSAFITYRPYCDRLSFFFSIFPDQFIFTITINVSHQSFAASSALYDIYIIGNNNDYHHA